MKTQSLVRRGVVAVLLIELMCALGFSGVALWHERRTHLRAFAVLLQGRSDSLLGAVQDAEDPEDNVAVDPLELKLPGEDAYAVYNQGGRLLGSSGHADAGLIARAADGFRMEWVRGEEYGVLQREALRIIDRDEHAGVGLRRPVTIVYAAPMRHIQHAIREAAAFYAAVGVALVLGTTVLLLVAIKRLFGPLEELAAAAGAVNAVSLRFEAPAGAARVLELQPLVGALEEAMQRLREAFEAQHRFVGDAAHELKTAVAVVRSTVQLMMLRERTGEEYREGLERVLGDSERVETLVARMLTLARFEERLGACSSVCDVSGVAERTVQGLGGFAESRGVLLRADVGAAVSGYLTAEATEALVSNLVVNAVQHSAEGGEVSVVLAREAGMAVLEVRDGGAGIAAEEMPHLFERFYRADHSRSRLTGGAGLGLAICKSIVDGVGGRIEVRSAVGEGTTVAVFFRSA